MKKKAKTNVILFFKKYLQIIIIILILIQLKIFQFLLEKIKIELNN